MTEPAAGLERRIARRRARVFKWDREATAIELWWVGGPDYKEFCNQLAAAARRTCVELEAKLSLCNEC